MVANEANNVLDPVRVLSWVKLLVAASLLVGCGRRATLPPAKPPEIELVRQVNSESGEKLNVVGQPPVSAASVLYFRSSTDEFPSGSLVLERCMLDYGDGQLQPCRIVTIGIRELAAIVPWGYRSVPRKVRCTLRGLTRTGRYEKQWTLKPLPKPIRRLALPGPDPTIAAFHTAIDGRPAIEFRLRKPAKAGWQFMGRLTRLSYLDQVDMSVVPSERIPFPFAADQDAAHIVWRLEKPTEQTGVLRIDDCSIEANTGKIYLNVNRTAKVDVAGRGTISIPKQIVHAVRVSRGRTNGFTATLSGTWTRTPPYRNFLQGTGFAVTAGVVDMDRLLGDDPTKVTFTYAGPDLSRFGLLDVKVEPADRLDRRSLPLPTTTATITPGPLPPISIRYHCTWEKLGPIHNSNVPIETKR